MVYVNSKNLKVVYKNERVWVSGLDGSTGFRRKFYCNDILSINFTSNAPFLLKGKRKETKSYNRLRHLSIFGASFSLVIFINFENGGLGSLILLGVLLLSLITFFFFQKKYKESKDPKKYLTFTFHIETLGRGENFKYCYRPSNKILETPFSRSKGFSDIKEKIDELINDISKDNLVTKTV